MLNIYCSEPYLGPVQRKGSARVFGYTVYRAFLNRVYGILQLKFGISLASLTTNFRYTVYNASINFGYIGMNFGYFGKFSSGILVYH